jgi:two-component system nitrogen regulation sensor histidine kinase GlnL
MLESLSTAVVLVDAGCKVLYVNPAAEVLLQLSARQTLGRRLADFIQAAEELEALVERTHGTGLTFSRREMALSVGEHRAIVDCRATPFIPARGILLEFADVERTLRIQREAELLAQQDLSRRMLRQLAHEIKNPLGGLRGAAQLLARQLPDNVHKAYTDVIIGEADRLAALVDGMLRPAEQPRQRIANVHEVTEHVAQLIGAEKPTQVSLHKDYDPSLPPAFIDVDQLIQAFLNLGKNALEAVGDEGNLTFRTRALSNFNLNGERHRLVLSLEVEDDGPGIPEELTDTVFYPLVTGRSTGNGLGLTIAQELVSRNGGLIEFSSVPGNTRFQVRLPASQTEKSAETT